MNELEHWPEHAFRLALGSDSHILELRLRVKSAPIINEAVKALGAPSHRTHRGLLSGLLIISHPMTYKESFQGVSVCKHYLLIGRGANIWFVQ